MQKQADPERMFRLCTPGSEVDEPAFLELLVAYGQAMWSWSRVEDKWFLVFAHAVEPSTNNHSRALREAFFSIVGARARLNMIHSVARVMWEKKTNTWKAWADLHDECEKQLKIRGRMAHLVGHAMYPADKRKKPVTVIMEPIHHPKSPRTHGEAKSSGFTSDQLSRYAREWGHLNERLGVFCALAQHERQHGASDELTARLRDLLRTQYCRIHHRRRTELPLEDMD
jgi:hypothetical protein